MMAAWVRSVEMEMGLSAIISRRILKLESIAICDELDCVLGEGSGEWGGREDGTGPAWGSSPRRGRMTE